MSGGPSQTIAITVVTAPPIASTVKMMAIRSWMERRARTPAGRPFAKTINDAIDARIVARMVVLTCRSRP